MTIFVKQYIFNRCLKILILKNMYQYDTFLNIFFILYIGRSFDFFLKKASSKEARIFIKLCFLCIGCRRKNEPLFVKYFFGDYKLKIIESV